VYWCLIHDSLGQQNRIVAGGWQQPGNDASTSAALAFDGLASIVPGHESSTNKQSERREQSKLIQTDLRNSGI
jgi:hypothetical protein